MIQVYVYSSCSSCRKTVEALEASGAAFEVRDYLKHRFTAGELREILTGVGLTPAMVLSTRSRIYRERELDAETLSDDELVRLMIEEPTLLRRPIVTSGEQVVIGHNPGRLASLIAS